MLRESFRLMMQAVEESPYQGFSMKQCTRPASQGNLFVKDLDLWQQTTGQADEDYRKFPKYLDTQKICCNHS